MKNLNYLLAANLIVWIAFFAYHFSLSRRNSQLQKEIDLVLAKLESKGPGASCQGSGGRKKQEDVMRHAS
jgi:CcmD family protein